LLSASASKSIPQGAGIDVARSYIALVLGLLLLNCLRGGIGGGIVRYNVHWNIGPSCPFASLLLRITASPGTGGSALVLLVL